MRYLSLLCMLIAGNVMADALIIEVPAVEVPAATAEPVPAEVVKSPEVVVETSTIRIEGVALPEVDDPAKRIAQIQEFFRFAQKTFRDRRNWKNDRSFGIDSDSVKKWRKIYEKWRKSDLSDGSDKSDRLKGLRMIAEVHSPINQNALRKNLAMYKQRGYNAVLLTFGYQGETLAEVTAAADLIRDAGFKLWFAYSGPEKLEHSVFMDPDVLKKYLQELSIRADGFLIGWRRTSVHLLIQDSPFRDFLIKSVRNVNQDLLILGEGFYGMTAQTNHHLRISYNLPPGSSGCYVMGFGFEGYDPVYYLSRLSRIRDLPKVAVIIGEKPYYGSTNATGKSFEENLRIKQGIESRWLEAGCVGTITLHGDCSDGIYYKNHTDNIGKE